MSAGGLVSGFWDDASGLAGLGWDLGAARGGVLVQAGRAAAATASIEAEGDTVKLTLQAQEATAEATLTPDAAPAALDDETDRAGAESAACTAAVRLDGRSLRCRGQLTRWAADPLAGAGVLRHLALPAADGALLVVLARAPAGVESHAEEEGSAWLLDAEGRAGGYPHAFLSTQYDADGHQTRAGLELWSADADAPPIRAAGTTVGEAPGPTDGVSAAILRTSTEGHEGIGSYLIWRG